MGAAPGIQNIAGLDEGFVRFLGQLAAAGASGGSASPSVAALRDAAATTRRPWNSGGPAMRRTVGATIDSADGPLGLRIHYPNERSPLPALVYLHGGGWTLLSLDTHDRIMREFAGASGWAVVGIEFPLAPETPFPGALRACAAAVREIVGRRKEFGLAPPLALAGDSSGANLALGVALALRDEGARIVDGLVLNYGVYDCDLTRPSYGAFGRPPFTLSPEKMGWFWDQYCPAPQSRYSPLASPLRADLGGLPPVRLVTAGRDVLRDENLALAQKLAEAGNVVSLDHYPDAPHGFLEALALVDVGMTAIRRASAWLNDVAPPRAMTAERAR